MWMNGPYAEIWEGEMAKIRRRFNKYGNQNVVHHETCPICGAKLVNLYRRENEWSAAGAGRNTMRIQTMP